MLTMKRRCIYSSCYRVDLCCAVCRTEDTVEMPEYQRERIETADFESLDWKLHGIKVPDKMKKLLKMLQ